VVSVLDDVVHKVGADEAGTAGDEKSHIVDCSEGREGRASAPLLGWPPCRFVSCRYPEPSR
jgi:hypothetical protein